MKRVYTEPKALKINYSYDEQVVARSDDICSGVIFVAKGGKDCELYRVGVVSRSVDPCAYESDMMI